MTSKTPQKFEFQAGIVKALLSNTPAAMDLAIKYGLTPSEVATLLHEALMHLEGSLQSDSEDLPIIAKPPHEFMCLSVQELRALLCGYPGFDRIGLSEKMCRA